MELSVSSYQSLEVELWTRLVPAEMTANPSGEFMFVKKGSVQSSNSSVVENPSFEWQIDRAGYFTLRIVAVGETFMENFNVTLDLRFLNCWELEAPQLRAILPHHVSILL